MKKCAYLGASYAKFVCGLCFFLAEIGKVLSKITKTKGCEELAAWIKPCE